MSFIRLLALSYLAWAAVFVVAVILVAHLQLPGGTAWGPGTPAQKTAKVVAQPLANKPEAPAVARLDLTPETPVLPQRDARVPARADVTPPKPHMVQEPQKPADFGRPPSGVTVNLPELPQPPVPAPVAASKHPSSATPDFRIPDPPPLEAPIFSRSQFVAARLEAGLTPEMVGNFDLFLYVSKADTGPISQHMFVFEKQPSGELKLLYDWAVSTGREQREMNVRGERTITTTPAGYYELDPDRMYRTYHSDVWDQDMPDAMFFSWEREGVQTGLAIHAATGRDIGQLGSRASAGCVRLAPKNAAILFDLVHDKYRGPVPRFAYDYDSQSMSNRDRLMHDSAGSPVMADGYRVLVRIENYGGDNGVGAALF